MPHLAHVVTSVISRIRLVRRFRALGEQHRARKSSTVASESLSNGVEPEPVPESGSEPEPVLEPAPEPKPEPKPEPEPSTSSEPIEKAPVIKPPYYPMERIPDELWEIIFIYCLPIAPTVTYGGKTRLSDHRNTPVCLSSVCRVWRNIICGTPDMWETCWLSIFHPEFNTIWLTRAGNRMLHLYGQCVIVTSRKVEWDVFLASILPFQNRWKSFTLRVSDCHVRARMPHDFEALGLETLIMPQHSETPHWMFELVSNAPNLRTLQINQISNGFGLGVNLEKRGLKHLRSLRVFENIEARDLGRLLNAMPELRHFAFQVDWAGHNLPVVTHTKLTSIQIRGLVADVLPLITLPSLRSLRTDRGFDATRLINFLERSQCHLRELQVLKEEMDEEQIIVCLQHNLVNPYLEKLEFFFWSKGITSRLFDVLRYDPESINPPLPHLKRLLFNKCSFTEVPGGLIADTIFSRCGSTPCDCEACMYNGQAGQVQLEYVHLEKLDRIIQAPDVVRFSESPWPGTKPKDGVDLEVTVPPSPRRYYVPPPY